MGKAEELKELAKLKEEGILTEAEFQKEKEKILNTNIDNSNQQEMIKKTGNQEEMIGYILIIIPIIASIVILSMNVFTLSKYYTFISAGTVLITAILATFEASSIGLGKKKGENGPIAVFFLMILFWVIGYPYYFKLRKDKGLKINVVISIVAAIIFVICLIIGYSAIEDFYQAVRSYY